MTLPKKIVLIGATGSIGLNTLEVIDQHPDQFELIGVAANQNKIALEKIAEAFDVPHRSLFTEEGIDGITRLALLPEADIVVMASTGTICLQPTIEALKAGKTVALASKEVLVLGGKWVMPIAKKSKGLLLPVDSEHNALFQCMAAFPKPQQIAKIILTASGGPFRNHSKAALKKVTLEEALRHPNWEMGPKITIDSATMANKGLEMMEAQWLFDLKPEQIEVVIHPQSIVHSMVQGIDGSIIAQMGPPSMTYPIQFSLSYPDRLPPSTHTLNVTELGNLEFFAPDEDRFPCLRLARESMIADGLAPAIFNTANNVAVSAFMENSIPFLAIPQLIEHCLDRFVGSLPNSIEELTSIENEIMQFAESNLSKFQF